MIKMATNIIWIPFDLAFFTKGGIDFCLCWIAIPRNESILLDSMFGFGLIETSS